jgi:hypothetical protein
MSLVWNGYERTWEVRYGQRYIGARDDSADAELLEQRAAETQRGVLSDLRAEEVGCDQN